MSSEREDEPLRSQARDRVHKLARIPSRVCAKKKMVNDGVDQGVRREKEEESSQSPVSVNKQHLREVFRPSLQLQVLLQFIDEVEKRRSLSEREKRGDVGLRELDSSGEGVKDLTGRGGRSDLRSVE